jgi:hypothetical protein
MGRRDWHGSGGGCHVSIREGIGALGGEGEGKGVGENGP